MLSLKQNGQLSLEKLPAPALYYTIHYNAYHHFFWIRPRDHNRKRNKRMILHQLFSISKQSSVFIQEVEKHCSGYSFISI